MQLKPRFLTLALGLALAPFTAAFAQDIELITEAPVTFQVTFGTSITTNNGKTGSARVDTTRSYNSALSTPDIIRGLLGLSASDSITGWRLAAVRSLPADDYEVDSEFYLYLVNDSLGERRLITAEQFQILTTFSVTDSTVTHVTRNIITGKGTVTGHTEMKFLPTFTRKELPAVVTGTFSENVGGANRTYNLSVKTDATFTLDNMATAGYATVNFATRSTEPVFYFAIERVRFSARGDFTGNLINTVTTTKKFTTRGIPDELVSTEVGETPVPAGGLVSVQVVVGAAKLIPRELYPEVPFDPYASIFTF